MQPRTTHTIFPALLLVAALAGCGSAVAGQAPNDPGPPATANRGSTSRSAVPAPITVRKPLSDMQRQALLTWMTGWRSCMAGQGIDLPAPEVHPRHISIDVSAVDGYLDPNKPLPAVPSAFQQKSMACITTLGGPPATFLRTAGIVDLFRGTCALAGPATNASKQ
jgi:hypothetical protein